MMSGQWLAKNAMWYDNKRFVEVNGKMMKVKRGFRKGERLFAVPLTTEGELGTTNHYVAKIKVAATPLSKDDSIFIGITDGKYLAGFTRTADGNQGIGKIMHSCPIEVYNNTGDGDGGPKVWSVGDTGWSQNEAPKGLHIVPDAAATDMLLQDDETQDPNADIEAWAQAKAAVDVAAEQEAAAAAGKVNEGELKENAEASAPLAPSDDDADKKEPLPSFMGDPFLANAAKLAKDQPSFFEIFIRLSTNDPTEIMAVTGAANVPVLEMIPYKLDVTKGLTLFAIAGNAEAEYGVYALEATVMQEYGG